MNGVVCLVPSKFGQCVQLAGHTGQHRSSSGFDWDETNYQRALHHKEKVAVDTMATNQIVDKVEAPVKRGRGRPRKWFKDDQGKWYKVE